MNSFELKKELMGFEKDELIQIIIDLHKREKVAARYVDYFLRPNENEILQVQMQKVSEAFFPKRGFGLKLKEARSAVSEFKKFEPAPKLYASLMLYYVECGVKFAGEYGLLALAHSN